MGHGAGPEKKAFGRGFDIQEPSGLPATVLQGGDIGEWERIDKLLMRRRIVRVLLIAILLVIIGGLVAGIRGAHPTVIGALAALVGAPVAVIVRYYFHA